MSAIQEIQVGLREGIDPRAEALQGKLNEWGMPHITVSNAATVYRFEGVGMTEAETLAREVLTDPTQKFAVNTSLADGTASSLEIGYKPGVMNPMEASLHKAAQIKGISPNAASSSTIYYFSGNVPQEQLAEIGKRLASQVQTALYEKPKTLMITGEVGPVETIPISNLDNSALDALSNTRRLFLNTQEMQVIQRYFRETLQKDPTDIELETLAQTWSEHNGHKTFKAKLIEGGREKKPLIERIREEAEKHFDKAEVVTAFADNAGGISFYDGQVIIAKGETHNSPVAIEPFGGSQTKNGGVYRDIAGTGQGGHNLFGLMINCFADPATNASNVPTGCLHPKHLLTENFRGENSYGNQKGIATLGVSLHFHPDFVAKPTSMGIAVGIIPENRVEKGEPRPGDLLVTVGGKTGRDGIHGATFSSGEMTAETKTVDATAVQIGNAIEQKRAFDALIAARDANLIRATTDCGGGGYSSAIGEIGENTGVEVHLDTVPLKYTGLAPWEIWLSESQERMIVAIAPENWEAFQHICAQFDAPADVIGTFTADQTLTLKYGEDTVGQLSMEFLHKGLPQREMQIEYRERQENNDLPSSSIDWTVIYQQVLSSLNVCSKEPMHRQYDQTVQAMTVLAPYTGVDQDMPNDAVVVAPLYGKPYGVVAAHALNPILNRYDPYGGTLWTIAQAACKYAAVGGNIHEAAMIDNFVWPKPTAESMGDLDKSVDALCFMMNQLGIPVVSGKDSLSGTYKGGNTEINIPPVLNITLFGKIPDVEKTVTGDLKSTNSTLILVGNPDVTNLGGSVYFQTEGIENTHIPTIDVENLPCVLDAIHAAIQTGKVKACKTIGEGGLAATLAQMCFGGDCGADIDVESLGGTRTDFVLFQETPGCFVVEVQSEDEANTLFGSVGYKKLGRTTAEKKITVRQDKQKLFAADLYELKEAWQKPMKEVLS